MTPVAPFERLHALPRVAFLDAPSPLARLPRFERSIESPYPIFIKRDDAIPFAFGGNKVRKLELEVARCLAEGADTIVTCGGVQSNHCRATAAAAAHAGLACHLVLSGEEPKVLTGNTRLDGLFGAQLHFVVGRSDREPAMQEIARDLRARGAKPFIIPLGASTPLGAAGFARAIDELWRQGPPPNVILHASSSGGTQAGLLAGLTLLGARTRLIGVSADERAPALEATVDRLAQGVLDLAEVSVRATPAEVKDEFVGEGYGVPTPVSVEAQTLLARAEGIVVDHTYSAKALACLVHMVRTRAFREGASLLFWHTGGQVGVFA